MAETIFSKLSPSEKTRLVDTVLQDVEDDQVAGHLDTLSKSNNRRSTELSPLVLTLIEKLSTVVNEGDITFQVPELEEALVAGLRQRSN